MVVIVTKAIMKIKYKWWLIIGMIKTVRRKKRLVNMDTMKRKEKTTASLITHILLMS